MHGQSNAVNSPASVQSPSASSQPVQQQPQAKPNSKTVRALQSVSIPTGQSPILNPTFQKRVTTKNTVAQIELLKQAFQEITPTLAARCSETGNVIARCYSG